MNDTKRTVPVYQRTGSRPQTVAGVTAVLKPGDSADNLSATWLIRISTLVPRAGDRCRGADGVWWTIREVGPLADGARPCLCDRDKGASE